LYSVKVLEESTVTVGFFGHPSPL